MLCGNGRLSCLLDPYLGFRTVSSYDFSVDDVCRPA
jgi:hypothetical protein